MAKNEAGVHVEKKKKNVLVVCPTGGITVGMLVLRLKNELPSINVVDVLSIREFTTRALSPDIDAVLTTAPALTNPKVKIIYVSPLLGKEDVQTITTQLNLG
jgi:mannitol operon transcriptional antiterminator